MTSRAPCLRPLGFFCLILLCLITNLSHAQSNETWRSWNQPVEPFRITENLYYVGASDIASFLITTKEGHILLEAGFEETVPLIRASIAKLGFKEKDIKILLTSHAHIDHAAGLAEFKKTTGARLVATAAEAEQLARGGKRDFHYGDKLAFPAVAVDEVVPDRGTVKLGGMILTAHLTPGHTKGCTTWTIRLDQEGRSFDVVFAASLSAPGYTLEGNTAYPDIWSDFQGSLARLRGLPCDVFLAAHGFMFHLSEKSKSIAAQPDRNPFVDPKGYRNFIDKAEANLVAQRAKQRASQGK